MNKQETKMLVMATTFVLFSAEGLIHFQLGACRSNGGKYKFVLPNFQESVKIFGVVAAFSILNGVIIGVLTKNT